SVASCTGCMFVLFFFSSRRRHTRSKRDWSSDVCSSDLSPHRSPTAPRNPNQRLPSPSPRHHLYPRLLPPRKVLHHCRLLFRSSQDRKSTRLNSSHVSISYAVFCLKKKKNKHKY